MVEGLALKERRLPPLECLRVWVWLGWRRTGTSTRASVVGRARARSKEQGARSKEQGARSKEQGARSKEQGARRKPQGARRSKIKMSQLTKKEPGARSQEQGARSKEQGASPRVGAACVYEASARI